MHKPKYFIFKISIFKNMYYLNIQNEQTSVYINYK